MGGEETGGRLWRTDWAVGVTGAGKQEEKKQEEQREIERVKQQQADDVQRMVQRKRDNQAKMAQSQLGPRPPSHPPLPCGIHLAPRVGTLSALSLPLRSERGEVRELVAVMKAGRGPGETGRRGRRGEGRGSKRGERRRGERRPRATCQDTEEEG